ncbi:galactose oxidase [Armillaria gallica]|uniref:Galactose oxidase n=1 Tax=Armillaria gallica TaxID=47427 RepID=A0A2H3DFR5_ARMGA|nr:galactose oxidase [Armillaria gallica]
MSTVRSLHDVPEEEPYLSSSSTSPYFDSNAATASTSALGSNSKSSSRLKKSSSSRLGRVSAENLTSKRTVAATKDRNIPRIRSTPRLPHERDAEDAPSAVMYWSRAPVYGAIPQRNMRGHTVTLLDNIAWIFGGCDDKDTARDIYCFDIDTMQWSHPDTVGDAPPPSRAHTAVMVGRQIVVYGGGQGGTYYDGVYVFDTSTRAWSRPTIVGDIPPPRRAHTAVLYENKVWIFGGGNGMTALNDVWTLDVSNTAEMRWEKITTTGDKQPTARGYHTANLADHFMIIIGGSDGADCFAEIWFLNLKTFEWTLIDLPENESYKRLSHTSTQVGTYLYVQGGHDGSEYTSDVKCFSLVNFQYENRPIFGRPPSQRGYHVAVLADSRLFFFGGYNGMTAFDDVHLIDLAGSAFLPQVTSFEIML